jgi:hypothetical protein
MTGLPVSETVASSDNAENLNEPDLRIGFMLTPDGSVQMVDCHDLGRGRCPSIVPAITSML